MIEVPPALALSAYSRHVRVGLNVTRSAGSGLLNLAHCAAETIITNGEQLKTAADQAAEGWVVGFIRAMFPNDGILSEEAFDAGDGVWKPVNSFWTVDALDGTRSYIEGFSGYCVQVAFVVDGIVRVGIVHEPVEDVTYAAVEGSGAFRIRSDGQARRLQLTGVSGWPSSPRFVDSTKPAGPVGGLFERRGGDFVELGSIGLKLCRVADGSADIFAKELLFKLWDVAPGQRILAEAGGRVGLWDGTEVPFDTERVHFKDILAANSALFPAISLELKR